MNMELAELVTNRAEMHELERDRQAQINANKKAKMHSYIFYGITYGIAFAICIFVIAHINATLM